MKNILHKTIAMLLWAVTAFLAGYEVFLTRHIVSVLYLRILDGFEIPLNVLERLSATGLGNIAALLMAILAIFIVIGGWDYHWSHAGERRSFVILGLTLIFQMAVFGVYILLFITA